ncbi:endoglucanase [Clostridium gelidum]|uniref:Endoglucanase n=1 Tax=Clostridium gelidum TaxID=704125 RepID=A0ABN6J1U7_9CLOT|nr:glycoside hydrolase family 48 protein [Clostridium gelidum]BCZ47861.1 endoglucanase [Clostridium gelidum]
MIKAKLKIIVASIMCSTICFTSVFSSAAMAATIEKVSTTTTATDEYQQRFISLWGKIHDSKNGYFRDITQDGKTLKVPYHSVETLMCEAPDYGHETTSEAYSYYMWLEAMYGKFTNNWSNFGDAWESADKYIIPHGQDQTGMNSYKPDSPATLANEYPTINKYPSKLQFGAPVGKDPISSELKNAYGSSEMYGMHWLLDVDNWYGFGNRGDEKSTAPSYINTFQRGQEESCFKTIPQPSYEAFKSGGKNGFLDLFTGDNNYSKQWRYTDAPDADARAIQATYWADEWAKSQGKDVSKYVTKATKMGDYLRYSMFDKYFKPIGVGTDNPSNTSQSYLMSWYYAWGGGADGGWSWKIGSSHNHFGYQNPMAAWVLSKDSDFKPKSTNGQSDWDKSLDRQLEFYQWLQSSEGGIAGGATNSLTTESGSYSKYPEGTPTFYGMAYDWAPVYRDPPSNNWFGMQTWSMQRVAELYYKTGDKRAEAILDKWSKWVKSVVKLNADGTYAVPNNLTWSGEPDTWDGNYTGNSGLHVKVKDYSQDIGVTSSLANTLMYYSVGKSKHSTYDASYTNLAKELLDRMWNLNQDDKGLSVKEERADYSKMFDTKVYTPDGWTGKMPNGDEIKSGVSFLDIRSKYKQDPDFAKVEEAYKNGTAPTFKYHRFWAESEAAIANGTFSILSKEIIDNKLPGDANGDGAVDIQDYITLQKYILDPTVPIKAENVDLNNDTRVNSADLFLLRKTVLGNE